MAVPGIARDLIAVVGALLVLAAAISVVGTLIVPRPVGSWLTRLVDKAVNGLFRIATAPVKSYRRRDQILAAEAAVLLLAQLGAWLIVFYLGYALLFWPFVPDITDALITAGPGLWGIGGHRLGRGDRRRAARHPGPVRAQRDHHDHPADLLPAHAVRGVQPQGERDLAADRPGREPVLGPRAAGPDALRARLGPVDHRHAARTVRAVGGLGGRPGREPHHVPAAGPLPLAQAAELLGGVAAGGARLGRALPVAVPRVGARRCRPGCACAAG